MNFYQIQFLVTVFFLVISMTIAIAPQPVWPFDLLDLPATPEPRQNEDAAAALERDAQATLEALERETFREITEHELQVDNRQYTPRKCCKIGKKVADKGLYCNIDLMQVEKKNNNVYRRRMKFHGINSQVVDLGFKTMMMRVEKCYPNKAARSMFSKCCDWQQQITIDLENCKYLESRDARRECKQRVRAREG